MHHCPGCITANSLEPCIQSNTAAPICQMVPYPLADSVDNAPINSCLKAIERALLSSFPVGREHPSQFAHQRLVERMHKGSCRGIEPVGSVHESLQPPIGRKASADWVLQQIPRDAHVLVAVVGENFCIGLLVALKHLVQTLTNGQQHLGASRTSRKSLDILMMIECQPWSAWIVP